MQTIWRGVKKFFREADSFLLVLSLAASIFGFILVASATRSTGSSRYLIVQGAAILLGVVIFVVFSLLDMDDLAGYWKLIFAFDILFIVSTFFFGVEVNGNKSWLDVPFIGIRIQPAEIVKISFIVILARQMHVQREHLSSIKSVALLGGHLFLMVGLIWISSSDMGMALVYIFVFICMAFAAGVKFWWFLGAAGVVVAAFPFIWQRLGEYQQMRILVVIDNTLDPLGIGWQASRSKIALGSGQLTGQGLFNGTQTQHGILPEKQNDFIYAVAGEELGMIGCVAIMVLLAAIIIRCLYVASRAKSGTGALICVGIAGMLLFQTFENIGMCIGLTPVIGITLPFFSSGGSSVVTMFAATGIVSSVKMRPMPDWLKNRGGT